MVKVANCLSELNPLYLPEMGFVFSILETRTQEYTGIKIQRSMHPSDAFWKPFMFSMHLTHSASSTASIIFSEDICDSEPHLKTKQGKAQP